MLYCNSTSGLNNQAQWLNSRVPQSSCTVQYGCLKLQYRDRAFPCVMACVEYENIKTADAPLFASCSSPAQIGSHVVFPGYYLTGSRGCRTMNSKECVARGCALRAAMLASPAQIGTQEVTDSVPRELIGVASGHEKDSYLLFSNRHKTEAWRSMPAWASIPLPLGPCTVSVYERDSSEPKVRFLPQEDCIKSVLSLSGH
jgi:hypothetical protein